jgi:hypothetical protein
MLSGPRLYAALGTGLLIAALVVALMVTRSTLSTAREKLKNAELAHNITLSSLKGATKALKDQTKAIRELDRLGQVRKAKVSQALQDAQREGEKLAGTMDRLKASAASVRAPAVSCTVSEAVRAVENEI